MRTKNKKLIFLIIILCFVIGLGAASLMDAENVSFDNTNSKITSDNVQGAIEELDDVCDLNVSTKECTLPSEPKLTSNLVPVIIENDGTVKYADINTKWYDYCNKEWANAVMLISSPSKTYEVNDVIKESDIKAYFVWIPKYKYKLWNVGTTTPTKGVHLIDIVFDIANTTDVDGVSCATPMTANNSGNCDNGEYMTHPAFISMNVNGFWAGKFEITGSINSITVKPGLASIRSQTLKTFFEKLYNYSTKDNSHMMKNTEWGAITYLTHSKYGIGTEVNINNNSNFITGSSALLSTNQQTKPGISGSTSSYFSPYNTEIGYLASTTGNITGIYDMSGGSWKYMASYRSGTFGSSGFNSSTLSAYDSKYYDVYPSNSDTTTAQYRILGDATGELGPIYQNTVGSETSYLNTWYSDYAYFVSSSSPWFHRGGRYTHGVVAGQFNFSCDTGASNSSFSTCIVLSP